MFAKTRAVRAGDIGPVRIRACVDLRLVQAGPEACAASGDLEAAAVDTLQEGGGVFSMAVIELRV